MRKIFQILAAVCVALLSVSEIAAAEPKSNPEEPRFDAIASCAAQASFVWDMIDVGAAVFRRNLQAELFPGEARTDAGDVATIEELEEQLNIILLQENLLQVGLETLNEALLEVAAAEGLTNEQAQKRIAEILDTHRKKDSQRFEETFTKSTTKQEFQKNATHFHEAFAECYEDLDLRASAADAASKPGADEVLLGQLVECAAKANTRQLMLNMLSPDARVRESRRADQDVFVGVPRLLSLRLRQQAQLNDVKPAHLMEQIFVGRLEILRTFNAANAASNTSGESLQRLNFAKSLRESSDECIAKLNVWQ